MTLLFIGLVAGHDVYSLEGPPQWCLISDYTFHFRTRLRCPAW